MLLNSYIPSIPPLSSIISFYSVPSPNFIFPYFKSKIYLSLYTLLVLTRGDAPVLGFFNKQLKNNSFNKLINSITHRVKYVFLK